MPKILLIDTSSNKEIKVGIRTNRKEYIIRRRTGGQKAQIALPMIDKLLKQQGLSLKGLTSIEVNTKYGSFTGVRVGMAIANALSFALRIPVKKIK